MWERRRIPIVLPVAPGHDGAPVSAVVATAVLVALVGVAIAVHRSAPGPGTRTCDAARIAPFSCREYASRSLRLWFDTRSDAPTIVVDTFSGLLVLRVRIDGDRAVVAPAAAADPVPDCRGNRFCPVIESFFADPVRLAAERAAIVLHGTTTTRRAPMLARAPFLMATGVTTTGRSVLLTDGAGTGDQALITGPLGRNAAGCVTIGGTVVVLPARTRLGADGSITLDGRTAVPGVSVGIAGGVGDAPEDWRCGPQEQYWVGGGSLVSSRTRPTRPAS